MTSGGPVRDDDVPEVPDLGETSGTVVPDGEPAPADEHPAGAEPPVPSARVEPVVIPRWVQVVGLTVALFGVYALGRAAGPVLVLFLVAGVIALILNPLVKLLQRARLPRGAAIALVLLGFFAAFALVVALLVNPVSEQIQAFQSDLPGLIDNANASLASLQQSLDNRGLGIQIAGRGETALESLRSNVLRGSGDVLSFARELVTRILQAGFAMILILVIAIYLLLYGKQLGALVRRVMPPGDGTPEDDYPIRVQKAVFGYVRGQLVFSTVMGLSAGVALWLFGVLGIFPAGQTYAIFFGAFYGLMELIPYVGPVLGSAPAILVALFQGEVLTAVWLALLFLVLQQVEGHVVAPQIFGHSLRMNPIVVIFVLLLGGHVYGIVGALVALPLAAIVRETTVYLRRHLVMEPWNTPTAATLRDEQAATRTRPARLRCPECGTTALPGAEFCFACGTPVRPQLGSRASSPERPAGPGGSALTWLGRLPRRPVGRRRGDRRAADDPAKSAADAIPAGDPRGPSQP